MAFTITFQSNGGTNYYQMTEQTVLPVLPIPAKDGSTFDGWFFDSEFVVPAYSQQAISADTTLYAKWIPVEVPTVMGGLPPIVGNGAPTAGDDDDDDDEEEEEDTTVVIPVRTNSTISLSYKYIDDKLFAVFSSRKDKKWTERWVQDRNLKPITITGTGTNATVEGVASYTGSVQPINGLIIISVEADGTTYKLPETITVTGATASFERISNKKGLLTITKAKSAVSFTVTGVAL